MSTIIPKNDTEKQFKSTVNIFFKKNKINSLLKQSNFSKEKGFSCAEVFKFIFLLVFTGKNLFDSWFTYPKTLIRILELKLHTIAMVKAMPNVFYV
jgi:hypothetical protein